MKDFIQKYKRHIAAFFLLNFLAEIITPTAALALTSGPTQPEVNEFQAINASDMVDPATGDFSYNIPLLEVDGYPVNLSYRGGINMDQEATCVGLGWNMNVGSIARNLRGLPDDFDGDKVVKKLNMKDNISYGINIGAGGEIFGIDPIQMNFGFGLSYNNYSGYDFVQKVGISFSLGSNVNVGLGLNSSADGLTISPNLSLQAKAKDKENNSLSGSLSVGTSYNSRTGIKAISLSANATLATNDKTTKEGKNQTHSTSDKLGSISNGSSYTFGSMTHVPQITMPMHTSAISGSFKIGGTVFGFDASADISGNYTKQKLATKEITSPAYGYLNLHKGQSAEDAMLDFNREKDGVFTEATTNLPIPNLTYDQFSVMGQGVGGSYRAFRSDIGYVYDPRASNTSESNSIGAEIEFANLTHPGVDWINTTVDGTSGKWSDQNYASQKIGFSESGVTGYEPAYFKEMGEMSVDDDPLYNNIQEEIAVRYELDEQASSTGLKSQLITENSVLFDLNNKNKRTKRVKRNQLFSYLTVAECEHFGLQTSLFSQMAKYDAQSSLINGHHIGQITTTKTDGTRYVYGLPAYNNAHKEVSFNVSGFTSGQYLQNTNMVLYTPGVDDTESNGKGTDNFFTSTETPPYAYAYMLTAVLSSDYIDKTGDGPTIDDLGTYTLFKYNTVVNDYEWRAPEAGAAGGSGANYANLNAGMLTDRMDNKASYVYGKKDIRYLTSIEGKNNIAILDYSDRVDGRGVASDAGGTNTTGNKLQKKLDKITLYSKPDYDLMQANTGYNATILKRVNFNYTNELCPGVYNFSGGGTGTGKLTLKEINFTFGNSNKGILSPYKFDYYTTVGGQTIQYNPANVDRWGNYKPSVTSCPNSEFPYVEQNRTLEDQYVALWNLKSVQLPSGGLMQITYESDEYGYIQNKRAGQMFKVSGVFSSGSATFMASTLYSSNQVNTSSPNNYIYFPMKNNLYMTQPDFINAYLEGLDHIYFRFFVKVNCGANSDISSVNYNLSGYEFVNGYAEIDKSNPTNYGGVTTLNNVNYGWVKIKSVRQSKNNNTQESPISKTAWQMARLHTPKDAYSCIPNVNDPASGVTDFEAVLKSMASSSFIRNTIQTFKGYNGTLKSYYYGCNFAADKSWIRLNNPDYHKLGGGLRVKEVKIYDKWDKMLGATPTINNSQGFQYGQTYEYGTGVASYEPTFGADENSFRKPIYMEAHKEEAPFAPDNNMYQEEPMGESFFPSPVVVYPQVTVKSLVAGTGSTVHEYYTAKDFPTYVHALGMDPKRNRPDPILKLFSFDAYDRFTGSQGYSIEVNDMHGKPKAVHVYEEGAIAQTTSTIYKYKQNGDKLVNVVKTVSKDGTIKDSRIGVDYDFYADFRENNSYTLATGKQGNLYLFFIGWFPMLAGPIIPSQHSEEVQFRTAVTNKVIYKFGIMDRIENYRNGNLSATENLLWDAETGQVLLTSVNTEFKDPLYNTSYPGYWAYEGLAGGYKNAGLVIANPSQIVNSSGAITDQSIKNMLYPGDEIAITGGTTPTRGYVDQIGTSYYFTENSISSGTESSNVLDQSALSGKKIKVIRSGRHNLQDQKVGAITSFVSPLKNNPTTWPVLNASYGITSAAAVQLGNNWQGYCGCNFVEDGPALNNTYPNQYVHGIKGNQRKIKDYTYLTLRKQTKQEGNSNIRVDGTFENFSPFWTPNSGNDWVANTANWTWVTEATRYSPYGIDLENKDALQRKSAAQYGYKQTLPVAVTSNSSYKQAAFESFEYNDLNFCQDNHFGYNGQSSATYINNSTPKVQSYSHTGKRSIKVAPAGNVTISKQINQCQQ
jgi:hypothetical protein